jgi:hypothetical protein
MLNFVENLLENDRSEPMNDQNHSLPFSDPDLSFSNKFLQNLASCHTALRKQNRDRRNSINNSRLYRTINNYLD